MELYASMSQDIGVITVVTYDSQGFRHEKRVYVEEDQDGRAWLIVRGSWGDPKLLDDNHFWQ